MTDPDFLDSHAPYSGEVVTAEAWPMPEGGVWAPKPQEPTLSERLWELVAGRAE